MKTYILKDSELELVIGGESPVAVLGDPPGMFASDVARSAPGDMGMAASSGNPFGGFISGVAQGGFETL